MDFDTAFHKLLGHEGGFVDHPSDPGGATCWGITERVARLRGYVGAMQDLPVEFAKGVYLADYWNAVQAEKLPPELRYPLFDAAVNSGVTQAVVWLQRALKVLDDGKLGPQTLLAALQTPVDQTVSRMLSQRLRFMTNLTSWPDFGKGWARRIADLMEG